MNGHVKKRTATTVLLVIAIISIITTVYIFRITEEEYILEKAFNDWLTIVYGKGRPTNRLIFIILKRIAGVIVAAAAFIAAFLINYRKNSSHRPPYKAAENRRCQICNAQAKESDGYCHQCGTLLKYR